MGRALTLFISGRSFLVLMTGATIGPLALAVLNRNSEGWSQLCSGTAIQLLTLIAAPHVVATLYLVFDRRELAGVARPGLTIYAIPTALILLNYIVLFAAPLWAVLVYMLAFVHMSMWHFGRQNLGVVTFAMRISNGRAMDTFERRTITAGIIAGVLGGYHMFAPRLMLHPEAWPLDLQLVDPLFSRLWYGGIAIYAVLVPLTITHIVRRTDRYDALSLSIYVACVFFFLPAYVSDDPLFLLMSWSVAHGTQYLVFLAVHAAGKSRGRLGVRALVPFGLFALCVGGGAVLWRYSMAAQNGGNAELIKLLLATTNALTLAHYWVDAFLWKFGNPDRRAWLVQSFRFLGARAAAKSSPAAAAAGD
jgi:hypothetical protein